VAMDRCAVLVDARYLLGAAGTLVAGDADRSALEVDYTLLAQELIREAESQTGLPVLRLLWYDGAFNLQPTSEHRTLRVLPDVKVRLGELVNRGGRVQQKGVDSYLQRDLITLARNHAVADVVLLGGDEDLRRALEEAQDYGTRMHLWGVEAAAPEYNQSQSLIAEADRRWVIPADWIKQYVRMRAAEPEPSLAASDASAVDRQSTEAAPERQAPEPSTGAEVASSDVTAVRPAASPADLARLASAYDKSAATLPARPGAGGPCTRPSMTSCLGYGTSPAGPRRGRTTSRTRPRPGGYSCGSGGNLRGALGRSCDWAATGGTEVVNAKPECRQTSCQP
jgi:uncharacterized LabA/DUF88 family protein